MAVRDNDIDDYDPAKTPCPPLFAPDYDINSIDGPGGNSTLTENNEKGILETDLFMRMRNGTQAALRSNHDSFKQGIYATNSVGDND